MCQGQAQIGNFIAKKGGVVKKSGSTTYYMPWGAVTTHYIGEELYLDEGVKPALDAEAEVYWYTKIYDELNWRPPLNYSIGDGTISGTLPGGDYPAIQAQTIGLLNLLKRHPAGEIICSSGAVIYRYPRE